MEDEEEYGDENESESESDYDEEDEEEPQPKKARVLEISFCISVFIGLTVVMTSRPKRSPRQQRRQQQQRRSQQRRSQQRPETTGSLKTLMERLSTLRWKRSLRSIPNRRSGM